MRPIAASVVNSTRLQPARQVAGSPFMLSWILLQPAESTILPLRIHPLRKRNLSNPPRGRRRRALPVDPSATFRPARSITSSTALNLVRPQPLLRFPHAEVRAIPTGSESLTDLHVSKNRHVICPPWPQRWCGVRHSSRVGNAFIWGQLQVSLAKEFDLPDVPGDTLDTLVDTNT